LVVRKLSWIEGRNFREGREGIVGAEEIGRSLRGDRGRTVWKGATAMGEVITSKSAGRDSARKFCTDVWIFHGVSLGRGTAGRAGWELLLGS